MKNLLAGFFITIPVLGAFIGFAFLVINYPGATILGIVLITFLIVSYGVGKGINHEE